MSNEKTKALGGLSLAVLHSSKSLKVARERSMVTDQLADESTRMQIRHKVGILYF